MSALCPLACAVALALSACSRGPAPSAADAAPPAPPSASTAVVDAAVPTPGDAGADAASDAGADAAPDYPREGIVPLAPGCADPQVMLGGASYDDRSFLRRVKQAMVAHPEIEVVAGKPGARQVKLSESEYGTKYFSRHAVEMNHYAVIADCGDPATCLDLAAMVRAVVPRTTPLLTCGEPKGISGQKALMRGPWKLPAAAPNAADRVEVCSRVAACSVRAAVSRGDVVWGACWKAPLKDAGPCATLERCAEVARCFQDLGARR